MFYKNYFNLFLFMLLASTFIVISASSWVTAWLGLEINMISILPILIFKNNTKITDAAIKYFIIQAISSSLIIFTAIKQLSTINESWGVSNTTLLTLALMVKAGFAPTHLWLPHVICNLNWTQIMIMLSWQKIAPIWLLSMIKPDLLIPIIIATSAFMGSLGGITSNSIKKIMTFSSITNSSWMLAAIIINKLTWLMYFLMYCLMLGIAILILNKTQTEFINHPSINNTEFLLKLNFIMAIFSLAGLPPLLGFFPKLLIVQTMMVIWPQIIIIGSLILATLASLYFYLKMITTSALNPLMMTPDHQTPSTMSFNLSILNLLGNGMIPLLILYY